MKKRSLVAVVMCMLLAFALVGCGKKADAKTLIETAFNQLKDAKSYEGTMTFDVGVSMANEDASQTASMGIGGSMDMTTFTAEDGAVTDYNKVSVTVDLFGFSQAVETEEYVVTTEDGVTTYTLSDGIWSKTVGEAENEAEEAKSELSNLDLSSLYSLFTIADKTENFNGYDCYVLDAVLTQDSIADIMAQIPADSEAGKALESYSAVKDKLDFSIGVKIYVDKESGNLVSLSVSLDDISEDTLKELFSSSTGDADVTVSVDKFVFSVSFANIGEVGGIDIPEDALNAEEGVDVSGDIINASGEDTGFGYCDDVDGDYLIEDDTIGEIEDADITLEDEDKSADDVESKDNK